MRSTSISDETFKPILPWPPEPSCSADVNGNIVQDDEAVQSVFPIQDGHDWLDDPENLQQGEHDTSYESVLLCE